ncbi:MAG: cell division protein ZapA [Nitrospirae bacterium]|nr:cell division protein ZapA [Nitrospirota bacterium]
MGVEVEIFGQKYLIKGDGDPVYIRQLAEFVDSKMREVHGKLQLSTPAKVAVLAALNITHELFNVRKEMEEQESFIANKTEKLLELISIELKT